jgi:hypothetical protein
MHNDFRFVDNVHTRSMMCLPFIVPFVWFDPKTKLTKVYQTVFIRGYFSFISHWAAEVFRIYHMAKTAHKPCRTYIYLSCIRYRITLFTTVTNSSCSHYYMYRWLLLCIMLEPAMFLYLLINRTCRCPVESRRLLSVG